MTRFSVAIPGLATTSGDNSRSGSWHGRHNKVKRERHLTRLVLGARRAWTWPAVVTITRVSPRALDTAGLASALKGIEDEVASWLGVDDGRAERSGQVLWLKLNEHGKPREHAVKITVEALAPGLVEAARAHPVLVALLRAHGWAAHLDAIQKGLEPARARGLTSGVRS